MDQPLFLRNFSSQCRPVPVPRVEFCPLTSRLTHQNMERTEEDLFSAALSSSSSESLVCLPGPMEVSANCAEGELRLQLKNEETKQEHAVSRDSESRGPRRLAPPAVHSPPVQQTLKYFHRGYRQSYTQPYCELWSFPWHFISLFSSCDYFYAGPAPAPA